MKHSFCLFAAVLPLAFSAFPLAAKPLDDLIAKVSSSLVSFDYRFECLSDGTKMKGSGKVEFQDDCFHLVGDGLEIWCDGKTRWTSDPDSEEVVIEEAEDGENAYLSNPALILGTLGTDFKELSSKDSEIDGVKSHAFELAPLSKGKSSSDIASLILHFKRGTAVLEGAVLKTNDGTVMTFHLQNLKYSDKIESKKPFRMDEKALDSSWVVTDLR